MVSWGFAFKKGLIIFLWSILWGIAGAIIGGIISGGAFFAVLPAMMGGDVSAIGGVLLGIFAGAIVGGLVSSIGVFATIVKITLESVKEAQ